jgi:hypothetical protein
MRKAEHEWLWLMLCDHDVEFEPLARFLTPGTFPAFTHGMKPQRRRMPEFALVPGASGGVRERLTL